MPDNARYDAFTVMIVLNVEDRVVGIVVDSVSDVIPLGRADPPDPEFGAAVDTVSSPASVPTTIAC